jgi:hypothetical protein
MDENEIRVADAAGVQIRVRYISATHEVEVLDSEGRPKLKSVLREPVRFDGHQLVINNRTSAITADGSSVEDVKRWSTAASVRPSSATSTAPEAPTGKSTRAHRDHPASIIGELVMEVIMVLGLLAALGGVIVAGDTIADTNNLAAITGASHHLAVGLAIACVSVLQVVVMLVLRRRAETTFA